MDLENFSERMGRILLMAPLYRLGRRHITRPDGTDVSCMELGLMSLLFFFERMLDSKRPAGIRDLTAYLIDATNHSLYESDEAYESLARDMVTAFRPATGRRNEEPFFDWKRKAPASVQYSYIKADKANTQSNEQYYVLDDQGLELIFATKEYFNEYQLSINQLILRKQLEKGQFTLALRQVEEMRLDVETLRNRMQRIHQEIHRSIISEDTLARYRTLVTDINSRLKSEEEEFRELKSFTSHTRQRIHDAVDADRQGKTYASILLIEQRLDEVHSAHQSLLRLGIELGTSALAAAEEALYFTGIQTFCFQEDITNRMFAAPLPLFAAPTLIKPFLSLEQCSIWSPLAVFFPQRLERNERTDTQQTFPQMAEAAEEQKTRTNIYPHYAQILADLVLYLQGAATTTLKDFFAFERDHRPSLFEKRQFYIFWLLLYRRGTVSLEPGTYRADSVYETIHHAVPSLHTLTAAATDEILSLGRYTISNMTIEVTYFP